MQLFSPGTALALHGLWGVQCAAEQLSKRSRGGGRPPGCKSARVPACRDGDGDAALEVGVWLWGMGMGMGMMVVSPFRLVERRGGERNVWKGKERVRIGI
jgi:hypothetical protein